MEDTNNYKLSDEEKKQFSKIIADTGIELIARLDKEFPILPITDYSVRNCFLRLSAMKSIIQFAKADYNGAIKHYKLDETVIETQIINFTMQELED